jgi:predicted 3-demethylubiquinone-9 3-methyltransferase (glyoxalase superfamily)
MQKITPFLWFDGNLEEAVNFYISVFKNSKITSGLPAPGGKAMSATFELDGQKFIGLNGGPMFKFTEAISFFVSCENAGRNRRDVGEAFRRWTKKQVRLAKR